MKDNHFKQFGDLPTEVEQACAQGRKTKTDGFYCLIKQQPQITPKTLCDEGYLHYVHHNIHTTAKQVLLEQRQSKAVCVYIHGPTGIGKTETTRKTLDFCGIPASSQNKKKWMDGLMGQKVHHLRHMHHLRHINEQLQLVLAVAKTSALRG